MSRAYFATIVAVFVTTSLATNLLLIGARGPTALGVPDTLRLRRRLSRRARRLLDAIVAAMIARRERQATGIAVCQLDDRQLRDIGLHRDCLGNISDMYGDRLGGRSISHRADVR
jgi:uncharacterized protein DUF1127